MYGFKHATYMKNIQEFLTKSQQISSALILNSVGFSKKVYMQKKNQIYPSGCSSAAIRKYADLPNYKETWNT